MNRRESIKHLLVTGSLVSLPVWANGWNKESISVADPCFSEGEQQILSSIADTIIPAGKEGVGALSLGVDEFLRKLFSDCYPSEAQQQIKSQLEQINNKSQANYQVSFQDCGKFQKISILEQFSCSDNEETRETFQLIKRETIRGFRTSKEVMTKFLDYQVMPGHFNGCVETSS